ncbi:hypothetical protein B0T17DRAFT_542139 [Bombardia bombarda]|uniref:PHD-type domain-containing protein n=1 Tax=Bombardia bombarda TaxID=252184 RepID=A0AA39TMN8_9PEZI|nr:hypothetical protein B0T17DRAFT_542139 [Bombardia bombarda]
MAFSTPPVAAAATAAESKSLKMSDNKELAGEQPLKSDKPPFTEPQSPSILPSTLPKDNLTTPNSDNGDSPTSQEKSAMAGESKPAAPSKKKKGTATVVKAQKRTRPGGGGGRKKAKTSGDSDSISNNARKKTDAASSSATALPHDGDSGDVFPPSNSGESGEVDNGLYCLCRGPDNHQFMIACDKCEDWFHGDCIGMDKYTGEELVLRYICPRCDDGDRNVTRYKKLCSVDGCTQPARLYDNNNMGRSKDRSVFCSEDHCQAWWEQMIATLPRTKSLGVVDKLTQEELMGLLNASKKRQQDQKKKQQQKNGGDKDALPSLLDISDRPFGVSSDASDPWENIDPQIALTSEEHAILEQSAADRHHLGEEIGRCKKMLQLIDMAVKRREAAIAAAPGKPGAAKDMCGYDARLDAVDAPQQFAVFLQSPAGKAIFKSGGSGRLEAPIDGSDSFNDDDDDPLTAGMCTKRKCKPHSSWAAILTKSVKHSIKEQTAQAKEKLDAETRIKHSAAERFRRKLRENTSVVVVVDSDQEMMD